MGDARIESLPNAPRLSTVRNSVVVRRSLYAALVITTLLSISLYRGFFNPPWLTANDFTADYISARALVDGVNPYETVRTLKTKYLGAKAPYFGSPQDQRNSHPPFMILLFVPFALLPYTPARALLLGLTCVATVFAVIRFVREMGGSRRAQLLTAAVVLNIPVVRSDFFYGQIDGLLLLLFVEGWIALRHDNERRAGLLLGALTALKLFPVLMLIPLLRMRKSRAIAWMLASAIALSLAGSAVVGLHATKSFLFTASPANTKFWITQPGNLSLLSLPFRWLTKSYWMSSAINAPTVAFALATVIALAGLIALSKTPAFLSNDLYWAAVPWLLLLSPLSWEIYIVLVIPLAFILVRRSSALRSTRVVVVVGAILTLMGRVVADEMIHAGVSGLSIPVQVLGYSLPMYGLLMIVCCEWRRVDSIGPKARELVAVR